MSKKKSQNRPIFAQKDLFEFKYRGGVIGLTTFLGSKCSATELVPLATDDRTDVNQSPPHLLIIRACPQIGQHLLDLVVSHGTIV